MTDKGVEAQSGKDVYEPPAVVDLGAVFTITTGSGSNSADNSGQSQD